MFEQSLVNRNVGARRPVAVFVSSIGQVLLIGLLVVAPLLSTSELPQVWLTGILRPPSVPPPPPPAPVAPVQTSTPPAPRALPSVLTEPREIPQEVAIIVDEPAPDIRQGGGAVGGMGEPGGADGGVIGSIVAESYRALPPPPPKPAPAPVAKTKAEPVRRIRVGGAVEPPVLLRRVNPVYPPLARQVRVAGPVLLSCVVGIDGRLKSVQAVSGHPMLIPAAVDAVRQWLYRPTLLNGSPVEVVMQVTVNFTLR